MAEELKDATQQKKSGTVKLKNKGHRYHLHDPKHGGFVWISGQEHAVPVDVAFGLLVDTEGTFEITGTTDVDEKAFRERIANEKKRRKEQADARAKYLKEEREADAKAEREAFEDRD